jgi:hypothetical protein
MAGLTLGSRINSIWPDGTVVQARRESQVAMHGRYDHQPGTETQPAGPAAQATATVTGGALTFSGLDASTPYVLTGIVGGKVRRIHATSEAT